MELHVDHTTEYAYSHPNRHSIQYIRLTPVGGPGQDVLSWTLDANAKLHAWQDGFGNTVHTLVVDQDHDLLTLRVHGTVRTTDMGGIRPFSGSTHHVLYLLQPTPLTEPSDAMRDLVSGAGKPDQAVDFLHRLMDTIRDHVTYIPGETDVDTTAAQALEDGRGVCQDQAHIFASCARLAGLPARYVSGYLSAMVDGSEHQASHAWAEALVPDLGWVAFDPANGISPNENYIRVAVGRDYADAAPVRGIRTGAGEERLAVRVAVTDLAMVQQQQQQ